MNWNLAFLIVAFWGGVCLTWISGSLMSIVERLEEGDDSEQEDAA